MQTATTRTPIFDELLKESDPETQLLVLDSFDLGLDPTLGSDVQGLHEEWKSELLTELLNGGDE